jgi:multiple sugar transport system substrate-binding protein
VPGVIPLNLYSGIPMDEASSMQGFEMLLYGTKDPLYNYSTNKWVVSSKGFQDALDFVKQVYTPSDLLGPTNDIALSTQANNIVEQQLTPKGKVAINIDGSWISRSWIPGGANPWPQWKDTMGIARMPTEFGQDPKAVSLSGGWAYSISAKSTHKDQAFQVLKVLNGKDSLGGHVVDLRGISARKDAASLPAYQALPYYDYFGNLMTFSQFRPAFPAYPKISTQIDSAMQSVMQGHSSSDAMASFAQNVTTIAGADNVETHT